MANIFISHSSKDKPFVKRLAFALLAEGFPVWLDSWKMSSGDSLLNGIYEGIDTSSMVILVVSSQSLESGWVDRELNAAITKESEIGRNFVIPIVIDDCRVPLKVADRIFEDFSQSFAEPLLSLCKSLEEKGCRNLSVEPNKEIIGLRFTKDVYLDKASLSAALSYLDDRHRNIALKSNQIVTSTTSNFEKLFHLLSKRVDNVEDDPYFSPDFEESLRSTLRFVIENEDNLKKGAALLLNNQAGVEAVFWYCLIVRAQSLYQLWGAQNPDAEEKLEYGREWRDAFLTSNFSAAKFFGVERVVPADLWSPAIEGRGYFHFWIDPDEMKDLYDDEGRYFGPSYVNDVCFHTAKSKFILPQIVIQNIEQGVGPIPWDFSDTKIGQH
jgi:hypothetical protein